MLSIDGQTRLPARTLLDIGFRYRVTLAGKPAVLRIQAFNLTDASTWDIAGADALQVHNSRQIFSRLTVDL